MKYTRMPIEKESPEEIGYGNILYNLAESSVTDMLLGDLNLQLNDVKLEYVAHRGNEGLRHLIATEAKVKAADVLLTQGAAGALFMLHTALLTKEDHLIVVRPNYATNIVVPETIGCSISYIDLLFEDEWKVNIDAIQQAITPQTKLISITTPHNPTGMLIDETSIEQLIKIAEEKDIFLLVDETYRDTCFKTPYDVVASKSSKVISISSLSKAYGLPGLRLGWLITTNDGLMEQLLAAKEMIHISNSALDEAVAYGFYVQKEKFAIEINKKCMHNFTLLQNWLSKEQRMEAVLPQGGVVCFARFKKDVQINTDKFYHTLLHQYQTMVGPGHWFNMPDTYMRIGFGWADALAFEKGLHNISATIDSL